MKFFLAILLLVGLSSSLWAEVTLPDLSDTQIIGYRAGIRPYRQGGIRLERERVGNKTIVHHYGHGGAGITMSLGTATQASELVTSAYPNGQLGTVAVLGAGVVGLTTAWKLSQKGHRVVVYSEAETPATTSDVAGGLFFPSTVDGVENEGFRQLMRNSYADFLRLSPKAGVRRITLYVEGAKADRLITTMGDLLGPIAEHDPLPFPGTRAAGIEAETLLVDVPIFLPWLRDQLQSQGVVFERKIFQSIEEVLNLPQKVIVNALGFGAKRIFGDESLVPIRGQLVWMKPNEQIPYAVMHHGGYMFSRNNEIVLGGSFEREIDDPSVVPSVCQQILTRARRFFGSL